MRSMISWRRGYNGSASFTVLALALASGTATAQSAQSVPPSVNQTDSRTAPPGSAQTLEQAAPQVDPIPAPEPGQGAQPGTLGTGSTVEASPDDITVVGSRASQQTANRRKRDARTATDSLVADDIGSFPDRNVNEAISRIPGVALNRNEFGEGDGFAVRGNGLDLTRVELDGLGVQSANPTATGASRAADLRELPAELVKSVDVVKGSTADMTEGGLGGTVQIKTRTGLDFTRPYFSLRGGAQQNSLGKDWTPDFNMVTARRFLNDRLGVIASGSYAKIQNNSHGYQNTTSGTAGFGRYIDFDNSPEKTFVYNLDSLGTSAADQPLANSTETPRSLLTKSIAAQTKAACLTAFPNNPTGTSNERAARISEQLTCLNQWNDSTPSLIRNFMNTQTDQRYSIDTRVDFRVNENLTVFAKGTVANREVHDQNRSRNPVGVANSGNSGRGPFVQNLPGTFLDSTTGYPRIRSLAPSVPAGYYLYNTDFGINNQGSNATLGNVLNVVPGSVVVDGKHNVTKMTTTNNAVTIDQIENRINTDTKYAQAGAEYRGDRLDIDLLGGYSSARTTRGDMRTSRSYTYGDATLTLQPNGLYDITLPANYDDSNPANFVQLNPATCIATTGFPNTAPNCVGQAFAAPSATNPAGSRQATVAQLPLTSAAVGIQYTPRLSKGDEKQLKLDVTYRTDDFLPFFTRFKSGLMYRRNTNNFWGNGGYTARSQVGTFGALDYVPAVVVPTAIVRGSFRACQPTATSTVSCNYGFVPNTNFLNSRSGLDTLTPQQLVDLLSRTVEKPDSQYFGDYPDRGNLPAAWNGVRTDQLVSALGAAQFFNADCLIRCVGSDGNVYDQPVQRTIETIKNFYVMTDAEQRLPWGLRFTGNAGLRGVFTSVKGTGSFTLNTIRVTSVFDRQNPSAPAGFSTLSVTQNTTLNKSTVDWLPTFNANLWAFDDKVVARAYGGKTVARPPIGNLLAGGNCTLDERVLFDASDNDQFGCGRIGNPGLRPFTAWSYNASLEWYPNADTLISAAVGKLDVKIGGPITADLQQRLLEGQPGIDPVTGRPLSDLVFSVPTYINGPGYSRNIYEFQFKTALTFLPSILRYTGFDTNLSILQSSQTSGTQDPLTAEYQLPPNESKYYFNASLWYDDGRFNIRVAYQKRTQRFIQITPGAGNTVNNNYPGENWTNARIASTDINGYNPGIARYQDGSEFIDAKASFNITPEFQVYVEGRNLTREIAVVNSLASYDDFEDGTPKITNFQYAGRRILFGGRIQFGAPRRGK